MEDRFLSLAVRRRRRWRRSIEIVRIRWFFLLFWIKRLWIKIVLQGGRFGGLIYRRRLIYAYIVPSSVRDSDLRPPRWWPLLRHAVVVVGGGKNSRVVSTTTVVGPLTRGWRWRFTPILQPDMVSWFINLFVAARQYIICIHIHIYTQRKRADDDGLISIWDLDTQTAPPALSLLLPPHSTRQQRAT